MRKTLQTGSGWQGAVEVGGGPNVSSNGVNDAADGGAKRDPSHVAALADTHQDINRDSAMPRSARNPKLGRTLRMEIKLGSLPAPADPEPSASDRPGAKPSDPAGDQKPFIFVTQRVGERKTGEFVSARQVLSSTNPLPNFRQPTEFGTSARYSASAPPQAAPRRRRELRPGERTLILTRRKSTKRDWLFVVLLVGALGVTASMLLSYRGQDGELGEETTSDAASEDMVAPFDEQPQQPQQPAPQQAAQPAAETSSGVKATELRSEPAGAEVAVNGAVVGNTPVRVARSDNDVDYTLRMPGYEPQVVRVGSQSPGSIAVTLHRTAF
ncbi:MAG: PEGA domain-containing protein [Polyangiales bacterium]